MKKGKTLSVLGGLGFLLLVLSPAAADQASVELGRLKQRALGLKSQAQALKGQYDALEKQQRNLEAENARLAARAPKIDERMIEVAHENYIREYRTVRPTEIDKAFIHDLGIRMGARELNDLIAEQRRNEAIRQAIPPEIAGIEQQKKKIKKDIQRLKEEYDRARIAYINLNNRLAAGRQQGIPGRVTAPPPGIQIPGRVTAPPPGIQIPGRTTASPPGPGMPGHYHPDGSRN